MPKHFQYKILIKWKTQLKLNSLSIHDQHRYCILGYKEQVAFEGMRLLCSQSSALCFWAVFKIITYSITFQEMPIIPKILPPVCCVIQLQWCISNYLPFFLLVAILKYFIILRDCLAGVLQLCDCSIRISDNSIKVNFLTINFKMPA